MAYIKQTWVDNVTPINAEHMNHIEEGVEQAAKAAEEAAAAIPENVSELNNDIGYLKKSDVSELAISGDWEDMQNKPFGETPTGGDTITWDGNTEGLAASKELDGGTYYKVCDDIPDVTADTFAYSAKTTFQFGDGSVGSGNTSGDSTDVMEGPTGCYYTYTGYYIVTEQGVGDVFPEKGVYLKKRVSEEYTFFVCELTFSGFTGFPGIKTIDLKYLPDDIGSKVSYNDIPDKPFGEFATGGDTVEWDGNPAGLVSGEITRVGGDSDNILYYYKVSDSVPTQEELQNGATLYSEIMYPYMPKPHVSTYEFGSEAFENAYASGIYFNSYGVVIVTEGYENKEVIVSDALGSTGVSFKCVFPEKGIYFRREDVADIETAYTIFTSKLIINNYTGFPTSVPFDTEYLPSTVPVINNAEVGQIIAVKAVDENGMPTEWETVEIGSGGGSAGGGSAGMEMIIFTKNNDTGELTCNKTFDECWELMTSGYEYIAMEKIYLRAITNDDSEGLFYSCNVLMSASRWDSGYSQHLRFVRAVSARDFLYNNKNDEIGYEFVKQSDGSTAVYPYVETME